MSWVALLLGCIGLLSAPVWADIIVLRSGKRIVTAKIKDTGTHFKFELHGLSATVAKSEVRHLVTNRNGKTVIVKVDAKDSKKRGAKPKAVPRPAPKPKKVPPAAKVKPEPVPPPLVVPKPSQPAPAVKPAEPPKPDPKVPWVGFRKMRWDLKPTDLDQKQLIQTDTAYGGVDLYRNLSDSLRLGNLQLEEIAYGFRKDQFYNLTLWIGSYNGFKILRDSIFEIYGRGMQQDLSKERYVWRTPHTDMLLQYDVAIKKGMVWFRNRALHQQMTATNR